MKLFLVLAVLVWFGCHHARRVQRLIILNQSELKIVPKFEFPIRLRTLRSTFNLQLPIQFRVSNHMQMQLRQRFRSVRSVDDTIGHHHDDFDDRFSINDILDQISQSGRTDFYRKLSHPTLIQLLERLFDGRETAGNSPMDSVDSVQRGQHCLKKIICQVSTVPLVHPDYGLLGELIDLFARYTLYWLL